LAKTGENAVAIRERVCRDAAWLGVELDAVANAKGQPCITTAQSRVKAWVIHTNEELMFHGPEMQLMTNDRDGFEQQNRGGRNPPLTVNFVICRL
jgi:acetate kinase